MAEMTKDEIRNWIRQSDTDISDKLLEDLTESVYERTLSGARPDLDERMNVRDRRPLRYGGHHSRAHGYDLIYDGSFHLGYVITRLAHNGIFIGSIISEAVIDPTTAETIENPAKWKAYIERVDGQRTLLEEYSVDYFQDILPTYDTDKRIIPVPKRHRQLVKETLSSQPAH